MNFSHSSPRIFLIVFFYSLISVYVVYKQATDSNAIDLQLQAVRHERMLAGDSEFFNPWQYRVFSTYSVEFFYKSIYTVRSSIDRTISFLLFRFLQNILIFFVADRYFRALGVMNPLLRLTGILIMGFSMAHSVFQSDLSFNTYFDVFFYLLAALLILNKKYFWVIPVVGFASLNRETSGLIPFMLMVPFVQWKTLKIPKKILLAGLASLVVFGIMFLAVRVYYGFEPAIGIHGMSTPLDYFLFNMSFFRLYPELIGTLAFLPFIILFNLKKLPPILRIWFWLVCPIWFLIHMAYSTAIETRLFLVPQLLIFIPGFLILIENWYKKSNEESARKNQQVSD